MYKAAIFDLDGTLLDTLGDISSCLNQVLSEFGLATYQPEAVRFMVGYGIEQLIGQAAPNATSATKSALINRFRALYLDGSLTATRPYPGLVSLVDGLREQQVRLAVHTNKLHELSQSLVEHFFPGRFDYVQGDQFGVPKKPDPAGTHRILAALAVKSTEAVFIGDSEADVATARNAGVACLAVTWGFRTEADLIQAGASRLCHTAADLRHALGLD